MIQTGFHIGDRDWWIMAFIDVSSELELDRVFGSLLAAGCKMSKAEEAVSVISKPNTGYTYTNFVERTTLLIVGKATSSEQMFDSIVHELKHVAEHIGDYYGIDPKEELSAYLQGEVGRQLFPAVAYAICPRCHSTIR